MIFTSAAIGSRRTLTLTVAAGLAALTSACGGESTTAAPAATPKSSVGAVMIRPASLQPGEQVPAPKADPVLTLTGKIATKNATGALRFDSATLDSLGLSKVTLYEPWTKKTMDFQGVWVADLLKVAKADAGASALHITALDDYQVDLTMAEIKAGGIFLATKAGDGSAIPIDDGGPTRIVFANGVPSGKSADRWIWSLKSVDVR